MFATKQILSSVHGVTSILIGLVNSSAEIVSFGMVVKSDVLGMKP